MIGINVPKMSITFKNGLGVVCASKPYDKIGYIIARFKVSKIPIITANNINNAKGSLYRLMKNQTILKVFFFWFICLNRNYLYRDEQYFDLQPNCYRWSIFIGLSHHESSFSIYIILKTFFSHILWRNAIYSIPFWGLFFCKNLKLLYLWSV